LTSLRRRLGEIETEAGKGAGGVSIAFPDSTQMLWSGAVHDWSLASVEGESGGRWHPPLLLLAHLAGLALASHASRSAVLWIGRRCWPYPPGLLQDGAETPLLRRSIFIEPPDAAARLWAIEVALRSTAVAAVVADASRLDMSGSRRLQLAAEAGGTLGLLARPRAEMRSLSAAATRWMVSPVVSRHDEPRWVVELLRCKGARVVQGARCWIVERHHAQGVVVVPADVGDRSCDAASAPGEPARQTA
jgi:protein ImuA